MINLARVKRGTYFDSITLMKLARALSELEEVADAAVVMATPANLQSLAEANLAPFAGLTEEPGSSDVLIVVRASDETHAEAALAEAETLLLGNTQETAQGPGEAYHARQPRSLEEATRIHKEASIAVISVPGMYAALEAQQALRAGLHVFLFSDNVGLEDEVALKRLGTERGLLVMGPDCGTARLNGVGLGFVNVVPDGPIGIVGASGTGMQQVMCLLAQAGYGISQAIGCGGRDLSAEVGGATTLQGLRLLQEDERTRVIVLISKPPAPAVAEKVLELAASGKKPVVAIFLAQYPPTDPRNGEDVMPPLTSGDGDYLTGEVPNGSTGFAPGVDSTSWQGRYPGNISIASTLTEAAQMASVLCTTDDVPDGGVVASQPPGTLLHTHDSDIGANVTLARGATRTRDMSHPPYMAALFSGGTLCEEALYIWGEQLGPLYSNIPFNSARLWHESQTQPGHYALDLGADEYTRGRPHPMIDPEARLKYLREAANNPQIGVILLDIVLGYCAHPDPAAVYTPLIQESIGRASQAGRRLNYVISLCGTEGDLQRLSLQETRLREAGAETYTSNAVAAARCLELLNGPLV